MGSMAADGASDDGAWSWPMPPKQTAGHRLPTLVMPIPILVVAIPVVVPAMEESNERICKPFHLMEYICFFFLSLSGLLGENESICWSSCRAEEDTNLSACA